MKLDLDLGGKHTSTLRKYILWTAAAVLLLVIVSAIFVRAQWFGRESHIDGVIDLWVEPNNILRGINPYERILEGDMIHNKKYPQMLPLAYLFPAFFIKIGLINSLEHSVLLFRFIMLIVDLLIALVFFRLSTGIGRKSPNQLLGLLCAAIWLMNRWTLQMNLSVKPDNLAMLFALLALVYFRDKPVRSSLYLGLSLSFKHLSIFLLPLLLIYMPNIREGIRYFLYTAMIPFLTSLPFVLWSLPGFLKSMLFALTRKQGGDFSLGTVVGQHGFLARLPLLLVLICFYVLVYHYRKRLNPSASAFLVYLVYTSLTPLLFDLYWLWLLPFGLLFAIRWWHDPSAEMTLSENGKID